jgi:hypothetical protein
MGETFRSIRSNRLQVHGLKSKVSVFPYFWIDDVAICEGARPAGLWEAGRPWIFPVLPKISITYSCNHNSSKTCET